MGQWLRLGTATHIKMGPSLSTDGVIPSTNAITVEIAKSTGAFAVTQGASNVLDAEGWFDVLLSTGDTDTLGRFYAKAMSTADHLPFRYDAMVVLVIEYDSMILGTDNLEVSVVGAPTQIGKNKALTNFEFLMMSTDHVTPKTGLAAIKVTVSKDGGAFAGTANTTVVTEVSNGIYKHDLDAADLNADTITLRFATTEAGSDDTLIGIITQPSS